MTKCETCSHNKVCSYKAGYTMLAKKINEVMPGEEMLGMGESYPFSIDVLCRHYEGGRLSVYEQLQSQQWPPTSGGSSAGNPNAQAFYNHER